MRLLIYFFLVGLAAGTPVWIIWQYFRPRFSGLSVLRRKDIVALEISPVVLNSRFVADVIKHSE
jgi:hypothetical protein